MTHQTREIYLSDKTANSHATSWKLRIFSTQAVTIPFRANYRYFRVMNKVINRNIKAGFPVLFLTASIKCEEIAGKIAFVWCMAKKCRVHLPLADTWMADYTEDLAAEAFGRVVR